MVIEDTIGRDVFLREVVLELGLTDLEIHALFPQSERTIKIYLIRKIRLARWETVARLLNSDTE